MAGSERNRRHSQRMSLQVGLLLRAELPGGNSYEVQAFTLVVNTHGGLLEAPLQVTPNQKMMLVNSRTGKFAFCRAVRVKGPSDSNYTIAFEFDECNPRFWSITFPPGDWAI